MLHKENLNTWTEIFAPLLLPFHKGVKPMSGYFGHVALCWTNGYSFVPMKPPLPKPNGNCWNNCDLWCIVSLPAGNLTAARRRSESQSPILYQGKIDRTDLVYDLSDVKVTKKKPLTLQHFEVFFRLLPCRAESERSWTVSRAAIEAKQFDLKAVNPRAKSVSITRTPDELLDFFEAKGREVAETLAVLRGSGGPVYPAE